MLASRPLYHEEQRFRQWWLWVLLLGIAGLAWWAFLQQILLGRPFGDNPAPDWGVWLLTGIVGLAMPLFFFALKLVIEVDGEQIRVGLWPFVSRRIPLADIARVEARRYHPIREYGGWGIKGWSRRNVAYNACGNQGVQLTLRDGRRVLLGSQHPRELAETIKSQLGSRAPYH